MHLVIGLLLTLVSTAAPARVDRATGPAVERVPIFLQSEVHDAVGARYVARFRDALAASERYRPVSDPTSARFIVGFLTMDPNESEPAGGGTSTVAAVTLQRENSPALNELVYSWVLVARNDKLDSLASELMAAIDQEIKALEPVAIRFLDEPAPSR